MNHPNWTSITQVMVHVLGPLQLTLFNGLCPNFGTVMGLVFLTEFKTIMWSVMDCCVECFVGISMPQLILRMRLSLLEFG